MSAPALTSKNPAWRQTGVVIFLIAITWAVFGQTRFHEFVNYDDPLYVIDNAHVRAGLTWRGVEWAFTHVHSQNWHPLTSISHMLDCQLFGLNPGAQHLVNVALHCIAAVLLFVLLAKMSREVWPSAFVAAVFAIHPLRVESVAWVAERKDVLSGAFFMLTLLTYFFYTRKETVSRFLAVSFLFACGLMSKPMLITTPIILLLLDYWPLNRLIASNAGKRIVEKIPLFLLSIGSCFATLWAQNFALGSTQLLPMKWRVANAIVTYFDYLRQTFWPVDLVPFYIHPENRLEMWRLVVASIFLIIISCVAIWRRRQQPYLLVGWFWYLIMLIPVIGIVQVGLQGRADRYTYLPQIGLCIAFVWWIWELMKARQQRAQFFVVTGAAIVLVVLGVLSWKQTQHWRDSETLWRHTIAITPDNDVAQAGLGGILFVRGKVDEAIEHYEHALRLRDGNVAAHYGLGKALATEQKIDPAIFHFQKALSIQPDYVAASNDLGVMFASKGEIGHAVAAWQQTLSFDPDNPDAANDLAWILATAADPEFRNGKQALALIERVIQTSGESSALLRTLAAAQAENGEFAAAVATAERAKKLAESSGDRAMAANLENCAESFRRGEPLHTTQGSH